LGCCFIRFVFSLFRLTSPVFSTSLAMESEYNSPYDHRVGLSAHAGHGGGGRNHGNFADEDEQMNHYEAPPTMLARNPSGSIYIPSGETEQTVS